MSRHFESKQAARQFAWDNLEREGLARAPFPTHGRIPNFAGATAAARRLFEEPAWRDARRIKVNPDTPQLAVRLEALRRGIEVYVPAPRLAGRFLRLRPEDVPPEQLAAAAARQTMHRWGVPVALEQIPQLDAIVTGAAAVTPEGKRCGKGAGYSDLEFALLLELGRQPVPVATTVHDVQVLDDFPAASNDLSLSVICTPTRTIRVASPLPQPSGIQWENLSEADIRAMPPLAELRASLRGNR